MDTILALAQALEARKGNCFDKNPLNCHSHNKFPSVGYQCKEFVVMTLQDALVAYKTYARAEGKSPKTIAAHQLESILSLVSYQWSTSQMTLASL
jgi:hypothetical protein